ncbi:hypothetical protein JCM19231_5883 [Vibrio ishigakensis]|uniref:Uncharacterized protein n=1 Tax=Vibrio ishigakensis TaxID=1481914 RepID=A0A0B8NVK9_9VIBR|nr:hypothetical protein JCM19231_5883 [Vibrio ishigakensis]
MSIDYSLSLDSNAAERFRIWEDGKDLDKSEQDFENLVRFIKEGLIVALTSIIHFS